MADREKVIEYLNSEIYRAEQSVNDIWLECVEVKLLRDALELLKEQDKILELQHSALRGSADMIELLFHKLDRIVLCKDCKHWSNKMILDYHVCTRLQKQIKNFATKPDWFCADGERKDSEQKETEKNEMS